MAVKIKPLRKFSTGNPSASDMEVGEIAVNTADQKIFMKDDNNDVVEVANASGNITGDLLITSTDTDAIEDPSLILYRNSSNPAVDDELGEIVFRGRNDNSENIDYVKVYTEIKDETDGTESGALKFEVMRDGNIASFMTMSGEANQIYMNKKFNMQNNNITNIGNLTFEGSTNDTNETTFTVTDPTADRTITFPDASGTVFTSGNPNAITDIGVQAFDVQLGTGSDLIFEGATSNANETTLTVVDPTADRTITLPDATGQVVLSDGVIDTDASAEIGRVHVGHMGFSDFAGFSHVDNNTSTNYALLQASNGKTYLNSASGQPIDFRIGNTTHASLSNTAFDITSFSDGGPILNLISNDASDVADFTKEGTISFKSENDASEETEFSKITLMTDDVSDGTEDGRIRLQAMNNGSMRDVLDITGHSVQVRNSLPIRWEAAGGSGVHAQLQVASISSGRTYTLPDETGTVVLQDSNGDATIGGGLTVTGGNSGDVLLTFATDRSWQFQQSGDNAATRLQLKSNVDSKLFDIVNSSGDLTHSFFTSSVDPTMTLTAYDTDATAGPTINLTRNSSSPAVNDLLGRISFKGEDSDSNETIYGEITGIITDPTSGSEDGLIRFQSLAGGNLYTAYQIGYAGNFFYQHLHLMQNVEMRFEGSTDDDNETTLTVTDPTADRTITLPDATGTVALTSQIPTVPTNASIHLKPHFVKVSNEDSATAGTKYIKVATINSSTPSNSSSTFVFRILLEGRNELNGASQFRVHIRTGDNAAKSSVVVEQEHSNRHTYYGIDSFIFFWNSQNNSEFWVKLPNNGDTAYQQLFAKLEVSAPEDTEYVSGHDDVTIHTSQAWTTSTPSGTNQITAEWIKKRFDSIIFEGSTTNTSETFLQAADPTADRTITLPDASGTVHTTANPEINGAYGSTSAPRIFKVTVATQTTAHPYNGDGSTNKYSIDGVQGAALTLHGADDDTANSEYIYRFDQSDNTNNGHPLRFYLEANKTTAYTTGVTTNGTPGQAGAYTQIAVTRNTPKVLYYQCSQHGYMGNYVTIATAGIGAVVDDTSPQLGGNLDGNTYDIQLDNNSKYQWGQTAAATYITGNSSSTHTNSNIQFWLQSGNGFVTPTLYLESTGIMMPTNKDIRFEGTAADAYETTLTVTNPTADRTITFPDASGTVALTSQLGGGGSASDSFKTIAVSGQSDVVADSSTDTLTLVAGSNMSITTNASGDSITFASSGGGGTASDSFKTISVSGQSDVVADSSTDTLTLVAGNNMTITTNASGDEISFAASGGAGSGISEEQAIAFAIVYG